MVWAKLSAVAATPTIDATMLGIRGTYLAIRSAQGPAQHMACAITGLVYAGMFVDMVPDLVLVLWAITSALIIGAVVWLDKKWLMFLLLIDFVLSCMVLSFYLLHDPAPVGPVYYSMNNGTMARYAPMQHDMSLIDTLAHSVASVIMAIWSLYLANLVMRQRLERARMVFVLEGEEVK